MTVKMENPIIRLPQNTTTIQDVQEGAMKDAPFVIKDALEQGGNMESLLDERAHEDADGDVIYYSDQWGIVTSNYFGPSIDVDSDELCDVDTGLEQRIQLHAYALCHHVRKETYLDVWNTFKPHLPDTGTVEERWEVAVKAYMESQPPVEND